MFDLLAQINKLASDPSVMQAMTDMPKQFENAVNYLKAIHATTEDTHRMVRDIYMQTVPQVPVDVTALAIELADEDPRNAQVVAPQYLPERVIE